ncbi:C3HC4 type (RING finger) and transmembrane domain-containing protein [Hexamita inflata]|uniref:C3HC4 type (RING finger) and transmembrane domain-containing protein n=1 Tax=Hexamita inflata TaxID=28002 RepID=A0AA86RHA2_9EUKA|nr:C3HC4 type (RING finger) and transmembrane domain-containing protein [Hexamita inflata]
MNCFLKKQYQHKCILLWYETKVTRILSDKYRINTNCKCFAFISLADNDLQCPICLESIAIQHVKNKFPLCITNDTVSEIKMIRTEGTQELYVTNCNHIFHGACLHKWALENPVCPVCRQEINGW